MTLARGSGGSVEPSKQRSAAPAEAVSYRIFHPDPLRQQWARSRRSNVWWWVESGTAALGALLALADIGWSRWS